MSIITGADDATTGRWRDVLHTSAGTATTAEQMQCAPSPIPSAAEESLPSNSHARISSRAPWTQTEQGHPQAAPLSSHDCEHRPAVVSHFVHLLLLLQCGLPSACTMIPPSSSATRNMQLGTTKPADSRTERAVAMRPHRGTRKLNAPAGHQMTPSTGDCTVFLRRPRHTVSPTFGEPQKRHCERRRAVVTESFCQINPRDESALNKPNISRTYTSTPLRAAESSSSSAVLIGSPSRWYHPFR